MIEKSKKTMDQGMDKRLFQDEALEFIWELREKGEVKKEEVIKDL